MEKSYSESYAAADDVVGAHGHAVDADGVMLVQQLGNADLGADAVGAGNQNRLGHTGQIGSEQTATAADVGHDAGDHGALHMLLHELDALITGLNVHAGLAVAVGKTTHTDVSSFH